MNETDLDYCIEEEVFDDDGKLIGIKRTYPNRLIVNVEVSDDDSE